MSFALNLNNPIFENLSREYRINKLIHDTTKKYSAGVFILYDFALLNAAFILVHFIKNQTWVINDAYLQLLGIFYLAWGLVSFIARKFDLARYPNMKAGYIQLIRNNIFLPYLLAGHNLFFTA